MKRTTITIPDEIQRALTAYCQDQEIAPTLTAVVREALRDYLAERGYLPPARPLQISPAEHGSGKRDVSTAHDHYFAER